MNITRNGIKDFITKIANVAGTLEFGIPFSDGLTITTSDAQQSSVIVYE